MTSMAFILGVVPLLFSHGAGAEMRQSLGVAVFSGMLGVTFFGVILTPVFFYVIDSMASLISSPPADAARRQDPPGASDAPGCLSAICSGWSAASARRDVPKKPKQASEDA